MHEFKAVGKEYTLAQLWKMLSGFLPGEKPLGAQPDEKTQEKFC